MFKIHLQAIACLFHRFHRDPGLDGNAETFAVGANRRHGIRVEAWQQLRRHFEYRDPRAGAGINVTELHGDHAATDEHDFVGQFAFVEDVIRGHQVFGAGNRKRPRYRPGGDDEVAGLDALAVDLDGVGGDESGFAPVNVAAAFRGFFHRARDEVDHIALAID